MSHISAAVVHGLPSWPDLLSRVHVIRSRHGGGRRGTVVHVHPGRLEVGDVVALEDLRLTSIARSVADCARTVSYIRAVAIGDAALRIGLNRSDLADCLGRTAGCRGAGQARRVASFIDRGGESVGESFSRILLHRAGLPVPRLQFDVRDGAGVTVARADFCWQEQRTLGEFDGRVKYGRLLKPGESPGDVVFREKVREDMVRDLGWEVVRWTWDDLDRPAVLAERPSPRIRSRPASLRPHGRSAGSGGSPHPGDGWPAHISDPAAHLRSSRTPCGVCASVGGVRGAEPSAPRGAWVLSRRRRSAPPGAGRRSTG
ncbi:MAG TPA: hypothetical protein VFP89_01170 [Propionibacteriaceae bacterium]|nr:hypothetical protein [Propionibacteriaceae bacterium]